MENLTELLQPVFFLEITFSVISDQMFLLRSAKMVELIQGLQSIKTSSKFTFFCRSL